MKRFYCIPVFIVLFLTPVLVSGECIEGDCYTGQGTLTIPAGGQYIGQFKKGKIHGQGTFRYVDGTKYVGGFKDGRQYVGQWQDDKRHGYGVEVAVDGRSQSGYWRNGEYIGSEKPADM